MKSTDRGSGPVTVILITGVLAALLAAGFTGVLAAASEERSSAEHAADAAALAGAQGVIDAASTTLAGGFHDPRDIAGLLGGGTCLQTGRLEASQLAAANSASLTAYCFNVFQDKVSTTVIMNGSNVDSRSSARAEAATTFDATSCHLAPGYDAPSPSPTPSPTGKDDDDDPPPPPPPPKLDTWVDCGFGHLSITFDLDDLKFHFSGLTAALAELKPRLTA